MEDNVAVRFDKLDFFVGAATALRFGQEIDVERLIGMGVDRLAGDRAALTQARPQPPSRADTETQTVLQNITVLSAGQTIQTDGKSQPITTPVVTLLVNPAQAEALALANAEGHVQLVLRNSTDQVEVATRGRRLHELYGAESIPVSRPAEAPPRPSVRRENQSARAAVPEAESVRAVVPVAPPPEPEQMIMIRGAVKKVEVFAREQNSK